MTMDTSGKAGALRRPFSPSPLPPWRPSMCDIMNDNRIFWKSRASEVSLYPTPAVVGDAHLPIASGPNLTDKFSVKTTNFE